MEMDTANRFGSYEEALEAYYQHKINLETLLEYSKKEAEETIIAYTNMIEMSKESETDTQPAPFSSLAG